MSTTRKNRNIKKVRTKRVEEYDLELLEGPRVELRAFVQTFSAIKTLNEAVQNGTYMMKLKPTAVYVEYTGQDKKTRTKTKKDKTLYLETYQLKGLKGLLRHQLMRLLDSIGIGCCHSTNRTTFGKDEQLAIPFNSHVHPLGDCVKEKGKTRGDGCLIYQIFGAMLEQSIIKVEPVLITQTNGKKLPTSATVIQPSRKVFFGHTATETRNVMTIEQRPIQNFREGYFDGDFVFSIDVTHCNPEQIGALAEALFRAKELGAGKTAGYGKIGIERVELWSIEETRQIIPTEHGLEKKGTTEERNLGEKLHKAYAAWEVYKETQRTMSQVELKPAITAT